MTDPSRIPVSGPLEAFATGFAGELSRQGYTSNSASLQMHLMAHLSRWLEGKGLDARALCAAEVGRFLGDRRAAGYTNHRTGKAMQSMLSYLRALGVAPTPPPSAPNGPVEGALERYRHYLTVERGLASATARGYVDVARPFLRGRVSPDGLDLNLGDVSPADVTAFVVTCCPHQSHGTAKLAERAGQPSEPLFAACTGKALSRDALERRLVKYVAIAARTHPSLRQKRITLHVLRHTAAMRLLHAGVDTSVIALWLGHEQIETTQIYLHADLALKERALARTAPSAYHPRPLPAP